MVKYADRVSGKYSGVTESRDVITRVRVRACNDNRVSSTESALSRVVCVRALMNINEHHVTQLLRCIFPRVFYE